MYTCVQTVASLLLVHKLVLKLLLWTTILFLNKQLCLIDCTLEKKTCLLNIYLKQSWGKAVNTPKDNHKGRLRSFTGRQWFIPLIPAMVDWFCWSTSAHSLETPCHHGDCKQFLIFSAEQSIKASLNCKSYWFICNCLNNLIQTITTTERALVSTMSNTQKPNHMQSWPIDTSLFANLL